MPHVDRATAARLAAIGRAAGGDVDCVLAAALGVAIARCTGADVARVAVGDTGAVHDVSIAGDPPFRVVVAAIARGEAIATDGSAPSFAAGASALGAAHAYAAERLGTLLRAIARAPDAPVGALALVGPRERRTLRALGGTPGPAAPARWLHAGVIAQARRRPRAIAIDDGADVVRYGELLARVYRLAHHLRAAGIAERARVAIALERSADLVVAVLAVLVAGATVVPLDLDDPEPRRKAILADADVAAVIVSGARGAPPGVPAIDLARDAAAIAARPSHAPRPLGGAGDRAAFLFYTTGSTGEPKGVEIGHRARAERLRWEVRAYAIGAADRVLFKTPTSFARLVKEILWPLHAGGRIVVARAPTATDPEALAERCARARVSIAIAIPSQLVLLLATRAFGACRTLRLVLAEGEPLPAAVARAVTARLPRAALWNAYGLTESSTVAVWRGDGPLDRATAPIGRPAGAQIALLDERGALVPIGAPGELHVASGGLALGYRGRAAETAARFPAGRPDLRARRVLRTGDLARWRDDGNLEHLGRVDAQVKLRGYRVEPAEVEAALCAEPRVREAIAVVRTDDDHPRLVAYVAPAALDGAALRRALAERLPAYLVPARIVALARLPRTPNGKVDRRALPPPPAERATTASYVAPRDALETALARSWAELLGVHPIGIGDDFFELGGDSLLAVKLVAAIERAHGVTLPLAVLLDAPTIERLAPLIVDGARGAPAAWSPLIEIRRGGRGTPLACVHGLFGNVLCFRDLADRLARPCLGLQAQALDPNAAPLVTVEAMAAAYVAALRARQPDGPYLLAGYSFGGMVAYEMAQQLRAAGARVGALILIDTTAPGVHRAAPPFYTTTYVRWPSAGRSFALDRIVADGRTDGAADRPRWSLRPLADDSLLRFVHVERATTAATRAYRPRPYAGPALLVRAADHHGNLAYEPDAGWSRLVAELEIVDVPGDHVTILSPPWVDALARTVGDYADAAVTSARR